MLGSAGWSAGSVDERVSKGGEMSILQEPTKAEVSDDVGGFLPNQVY